MAQAEGPDTLTPEQIDKSPEGLEGSVVDSIRDCTARVIALNQQVVEDEKVIQSTKPRLSLEDFKAAAGKFLIGSDIADDLLPTLYQSADEEGKLQPSALREFTINLNTKSRGQSDADVKAKCRAMLNAVKDHDSDCIAEERTFSKRYVLELMVLFALSKKLDPAKIKITQVRTNPQGDLLVLEAQIPNADGKGHALINYTIKGRHADAAYNAGVSCLDRTFYDENGEGDRYDEAGPIAEFKEGKWSFISPS